MAPRFYNFFIYFYLINQYCYSALWPPDISASYACQQAYRYPMYSSVYNFLCWLHFVRHIGLCSFCYFRKHFCSFCKEQLCTYHLLCLCYDYKQRQNTCTNILIYIYIYTNILLYIQYSKVLEISQSKPDTYNICVSFMMWIEAIHNL